MLECDGYKMFHGTVHVTPVAWGDRPAKPEYDLTGTWLFKPGDDSLDDMWYCKKDSDGWVHSMPPEILSDFRDDAEEERSE